MENYLKNIVLSKKEDRPWGGYEVFAENKKVTVKLITVKARKKISLQYHKKRDEFWKIISGGGLVTIGDKKFYASAGCEYYIPRNIKHRISAGLEDILFLEISSGWFEEKDIIRTEDDYGR